MSVTVWQCKCNAKYELREEWLGRRVRCKHCGVITRVEKPSSIKAPPSIPTKAPPPLPKTSVASGETSSLPLNKTEVDEKHDRERHLPNALAQTESRDVNPSMQLQATDIALAAEDAGIKTFDQLVAYSVKTVGERRTREIGGILRVTAKSLGFSDVRPVGDVLGTPGVIRVKDLEGEIKSLENIYRFGVATSYDLHELGSAYHKYRDLAKALKYFRLSADAKPLANTWVSLARVYSDSELSQDADAADACRRALALKPDDERAKELLETTKRKLVPLAARALSAASGLVESDKFFDFYISPFEMLQIADMTAANGLDAKAIQQAKKRLLHELELNDGKVSWLGDYSLDKARAIAVVDELDDKAKRCYHLAIYRNKPLLNFLTRGDIRHFLYQDDYFPCDTEELLHREHGFRTFLSKPFAKQYSRVLTRAIAERRLTVVEVLFDGRRWVEPEDDDQCFKGASKRLGDVVEEMRAIVRGGSSRKVSLREIEDFLRKRSLPELFNLLPVHFASYQGDIVAELRSLAISCFNEHDDSILSRDILNLCKRFTSRDVAFNEQLQEDFKTIEAMISAERVSKATQQVSSTQTKIWFYLSNGKEYGPFDHDGITGLARTGIIAPATLVRYSNGRSYCEAHSWGFLATAFDDANATKPRRPATAVVPKPETKVPSEILAKPSDASRSFLWLLGRMFALSPKLFLLFLLGLMALIAIALDSCSTRTSSSSLPHTPSVSSNDPVRAPTVPPPKLLPGLTQEVVEDLAAALDRGHVALEAASGTGASSGLAVDAYLINQRNTEVSLDVSLRQPLFLRNRGRGQNMFVIKVYLQGGSYLSDGLRSFISLQPKRRTPVQFLAYCADFDKDNPSKTEELVRDASPVSLLPLLQSISNYQSSHPNQDITTATQTAIWLAQGVSIEKVRTKFEVNRDQELLAREFLK